MRVSSCPPERRKYLKVHIECLKKAERAIRGASAPGLQLTSGLSLGPRERARREHIRACMKARGMEPHAVALMKLRIARSKFAAELEGSTWR